MAIRDLGELAPDRVAGRRFSGQRVAALLLWLPRRIGHELRLSWRFIRNDPVGCWPGILFTVAVAYHFHLSPGRFALALLATLAYFWLYLYTFCLTNQLTGMLEDRLNKPFRPLVTGEAGARATVVRAVVAFLAFTALAVLLGVWPWALIWQALTLLHNIGLAARNWVIKDLVIGCGTVLMLTPAWRIAVPLTGEAWRWISVLAVMVFLLIPVQDLRDIAGDVAAGRRTFPVRYGETVTRWYLVIGFLALPFIDHFLVVRASGANIAAWLVEAATAAVCATIAFRVTRPRDPGYDQRTYRLFEYWFIVVVASAAVAL